MSGGAARRVLAGGGQTPREEKLKRGSVGGWGPLQSSVRIRWQSKTLQAANDFRERESAVGSVLGFSSGNSGAQRHEGISTRRAAGPVGGGKPLEGEPQGRYRHETRPEGPGEEKAVERVRNPEGGTNPVRQAGGMWTRLGSSVVGEKNSMRGAASGRKVRDGGLGGSSPEVGATA
jgi:hypothetical protein